MCGHVDWSKEDDLVSSFGMVDNNIETFAESYKTYTDGGQCQARGGMIPTSCTKRTDEDFKLYLPMLCDKLVQASGPFAGAVAATPQEELHKRRA